MSDPTPDAVCTSHDTPAADQQTAAQLDLFDYGRHAAETRAIAAAAAIDNGPTRREQIAAYVAGCGRNGATRQEIADALALPIQSVCGPVLAMLRSGRLIETDRRRDTKNGKPAAVVICPNDGRGRE